MIKKLQRKFILITASVIFAVVCILLTAINVANYINTDNNADRKMNIIVNNKGKIPGVGQNLTPPDIGTPRSPDGFSPEMPYETRYFTASITADGLLDVNLDNIAAIDEQTAESYVKFLYEKGKTQGYYNDYKYRAVTINDNTTYVFLDCSRDLNSFRNFLWTSIAIGGASLLIVFTLIVLLANKAIRPYAESYNKQKQFITDANHELKTPLTVIKAANEVIELENGANEWTKTIEKQVARMTALTERLVFLSRMDEENIRYETTEFNLSETANEIAAPFESLALMQDKAFDCSIAPNLYLTGDTSLIGQLINILLDNAFKYSDKNGNIELKVFADGKHKKIEVTNTADNIDVDNLDKLFDRFYRSDASRNSETGGFGIGLSVAKSIVNLHKGKIVAESADGKRITFTVTL